MRDIPELVDGYRRFLTNRYPAEAELYSALAEVGQSPKTMIIACCDSRVDPAAIFSAGPGELFVVRNIANLVPPFEPLGDAHSTCAALEYAVTSLDVENIIVMGHEGCGGVRACLDGAFDAENPRGFINRWMSLLGPARTEALRDTADAPFEAQQQALEYASVRHSLMNLLTFPFIKERVDDGRLRVRGAYFGITAGKLLALDAETGEFVPVT